MCGSRKFQTTSSLVVSGVLNSPCQIIEYTSVAEIEQGPSVAATPAIMAIKTIEKRMKSTLRPVNFLYSALISLLFVRVPGISPGAWWHIISTS
jgi:hypothetical protein